tara:strand:+ start:1163 stop:1300 length:138 start_codon:yes stop_codon:yes gene_type:complete
MYKLWHSPIKPPIILSSIEEVMTYIAMMKASKGQTPYWEKLKITD